ncbi:MAG: hypothetical protein Tsb002_13510 [Wenzhouxiangellaceae bacterium]
MAFRFKFITLGDTSTEDALFGWRFDQRSAVFFMWISDDPAILWRLSPGAAQRFSQSQAAITAARFDAANDCSTEID